MQSFAQRQGHSYAGLEIIRGLAAATVVWCHVFLYRLAPPSEIAQLPGQYATEAVICFFVLSGAVVTLSSPTAPSPRQNFKAYMLARALRIYPVYVGALALSLLAAFATGARIAPIQYLAHLAFLQSMTGWPAPPLEQDYALWSLANEVLYYGLFAVSFFLRHFMLIWTGGTLILTLLIYPFAHDSSNGLVAYVCFMGTLSAPWLIGHWLVVLRASLPRVPVSLGLAICAIGLAFARCNVTGGYYDPFRLDLFAACAGALMLSILQGSPKATRSFLVSKAIIAAFAIALLWTTGNSLPLTRIALTMLAVFAVAYPIEPLVRCAQGAAIWRPLVALGGISYAVYAVHLPLIFLIEGSPLPRPLRLLVFFVILLAMAWMLEVATLRIKGWVRSPSRRDSALAVLPKDAG